MAVATGTRNGRSKLTPDLVTSIHRDYASGLYNQRQLGKMYGVSQASIHNILTRKTWASTATKS